MLELCKTKTGRVWHVVYENENDSFCGKVFDSELDEFVFYDKETENFKLCSKCSVELKKRINEEVEEKMQEIHTELVETFSDEFTITFESALEPAKPVKGKHHTW